MAVVIDQKEQLCEAWVTVAERLSETGFPRNVVFGAMIEAGLTQLVRSGRADEAAQNVLAALRGVPDMAGAGVAAAAH